jgi:pimeloyl-ACP methyl ester carboxylesterase
MPPPRSNRLERPASRSTVPGKRFTENARDGIRVAYETIGEGPPLFLFHGTATSGELWRVSGYVSALAGERRLILIDARGHGESDKPITEDSFRLERHVEDVLAVLDDADVDVPRCPHKS